MPHELLHEEVEEIQLDPNPQPTAQQRIRHQQQKAMQGLAPPIAPTMSPEQRAEQQQEFRFNNMTSRERRLLPGEDLGARRFFREKDPREELYFEMFPEDRPFRLRDLLRPGARKIFDAGEHALDVTERAIRVKQRDEAVEYFDSMGLDTRGQQLRRIAQIATARDLPDKSLAESFAEIGIEQVPILSSGAMARHAIDLWRATERLSRGVESTAERRMVMEFLLETQRDSGILGKFITISADMPAYMTDFAVSLGIVGIGKGVTKVVAMRTIRQIVKRGILKSIDKRALKFAARTAGRVLTTSALQTAIVPGRVVAASLRDAMPQLSKDEAGKLAVTFKKGDDDLASALTNHLSHGFVDQYIEIFSEHTGGLISHLPPLVALRAGIFRRWLKPPRTSREFLAKTASATGYHGIIGEMFEEQVGSVLRGQGLITDAETLIAMGLAFAVPAGLGVGVQYQATVGRQKRLVKSVQKRVAQNLIKAMGDMRIGVDVPTEGTAAEIITGTRDALLERGGPYNNDEQEIVDWLAEDADKAPGERTSTTPLGRLPDSELDRLEAGLTQSLEDNTSPQTRDALTVNERRAANLTVLQVKQERERRQRVEAGEAPAEEEAVPRSRRLLFSLGAISRAEAEGETTTEEDTPLRFESPEFAQQALGVAADADPTLAADLAELERLNRNVSGLLQAGESAAAEELDAEIEARADALKARIRALDPSAFTEESSGDIIGASLVEVALAAAAGGGDAATIRTNLAAANEAGNLGTLGVNAADIDAMSDEELVAFMQDIVQHQQALQRQIRANPAVAKSDAEIEADSLRPGAAGALARSTQLRRQHLDGYDAEIVEAAPGGFRARLATAAKEAGVRVAFFRETAAGKTSNEHGDIDGYFDPQSQIILLNADLSNEQLLTTIFTHEFTHLLRYTTPAAWDKLYARIQTMDPNGLDQAGRHYYTRVAGTAEYDEANYQTWRNSETGENESVARYVEQNAGSMLFDQVMSNDSRLIDFFLELWDKLLRGLGIIRTRKVGDHEFIEADMAGRKVIAMRDAARAWRDFHKEGGKPAPNESSGTAPPTYGLRDLVEEDQLVYVEPGIPGGRAIESRGSNGKTGGIGVHYKVGKDIIGTMNLHGPEAIELFIPNNFWIRGMDGRRYQADKFVNVGAINTDKAWQQMGIAQAMYNEALRIAQQHGWAGIMSLHSHRSDFADRFWNSSSQGEKVFTQDFDVGTRAPGELDWANIMYEPFEIALPKEAENRLEGGIRRILRNGILGDQHTARVWAIDGFYGVSDILDEPGKIRIQSFDDTAVNSVRLTEVTVANLTEAEDIVLIAIGFEPASVQKSLARLSVLNDIAMDLRHNVIKPRPEFERVAETGEFSLRDNPVAERAEQISNQMNMTAGLMATKFGDAGVLASRDRRFHLNTVLGRTVHNFLGRKLMREQTPKEFEAVFLVYVDVIASIAESVPEQDAIDANTGFPIDVMLATKQAVGKPKVDRSDLVGNIELAFDIQLGLFGERARFSIGMNFRNVAELLLQEFPLSDAERAGIERIENHANLVESGKTALQVKAEEAKALMDFHAQALLDDKQIIDLDGATLFLPPEGAHSLRDAIQIGQAEMMRLADAQAQHEDDMASVLSGNVVEQPAKVPSTADMREAIAGTIDVMTRALQKLSPDEQVFGSTVSALIDDLKIKRRGSQDEGNGNRILKRLILDLDPIATAVASQALLFGEFAVRDLVVQEAVDQQGLTDNFRKAVYLLPDGEFLTGTHFTVLDTAKKRVRQIEIIGNVGFARAPVSTLDDAETMSSADIPPFLRATGMIGIRSDEQRKIIDVDIAATINTDQGSKLLALFAQTRRQYMWQLSFHHRPDAARAPGGFTVQTLLRGNDMDPANFLEFLVINEQRHKMRPPLPPTFALRHPASTSEILQEAIAKGGITWQIISGGAPVDGFMVSNLAGEQKVLTKDLDVKVFQAYIDTHKEELSDKNNYVGVWYVEAEDTYYLDISSKFATKEEAIRYGTQEAQISGWDVVAEETFDILGEEGAKIERARRAAGSIRRQDDVGQADVRAREGDADQVDDAEVPDDRRSGEDTQGRHRGAPGFALRFAHLSRQDLKLKGEGILRRFAGTGSIGEERARVLKDGVVDINQAAVNLYAMTRGVEWVVLARSQYLHIVEGQFRLIDKDNPELQEILDETVDRFGKPNFSYTKFLVVAKERGFEGYQQVRANEPGLGFVALWRDVTPEEIAAVHPITPELREILQERQLSLEAIPFGSFALRNRRLPVPLKKFEVKKLERTFQGQRVSSPHVRIALGRLVMPITMTGKQRGKPPKKGKDIRAHTPRILDGAVALDALAKREGRTFRRAAPRAPLVIEGAPRRRLIRMIKEDIQASSGMFYQGVGWYDKEIELMIAHLSRFFPELAISDTHTLVFKFVVAALSPENTVNVNLRAARRLYAQWRKTATMDEDGLPTLGTGTFSTMNDTPQSLEAGASKEDRETILPMTEVGFENVPKSKAGNPMFRPIEEHEVGKYLWSKSGWTVRDAIIILNTGLKSLTPEEFFTYMMTPTTVGRLRKDPYVGMFMKHAVSSEAADLVVTPAMMLGPKVGAFFLNQMGYHDILTMDVWFARWWNTLTGSLRMTKEELEVKRDETWAKIKRLTPEQFETEAHGFDFDEVKKDRAKALEWGLVAENAIDKRAGRTQHRDVRFAVKSVKMVEEGVIAAPRGPGERTFIRELVSEAQRELKNEGKIDPDMTTDDVQAVLWYFAQWFWVSYGMSKGKTVSESYGDVAKRIVQEDLGAARRNLRAPTVDVARAAGVRPDRRRAARLRRRRFSDDLTRRLRTTTAVSRLRGVDPGSRGFDKAIRRELDDLALVHGNRRRGATAYRLRNGTAGAGGSVTQFPPGTPPTHSLRSPPRALTPGAATTLTSDTNFKIITPEGSKVTGWLKIGEDEHGEIFFVEARPKRAGIGTQLVADALALMKWAGTDTVVMNVPSKAEGVPFVASLVRKGLIAEGGLTYDTGTTTTTHRIMGLGSHSLRATGRGRGDDLGPTDVISRLVEGGYSQANAETVAEQVMLYAATQQGGRRRTSRIVRAVINGTTKRNPEAAAAVLTRLAEGPAPLVEVPEVSARPDRPSEADGRSMTRTESQLLRDRLRNQATGARAGAEEGQREAVTRAQDVLEKLYGKRDPATISLQEIAAMERARAAQTPEQITNAAMALIQARLPILIRAAQETSKTQAINIRMVKGQIRGIVSSSGLPKDIQAKFLRDVESAETVTAVWLAAAKIQILRAQHAHTVAGKKLLAVEKKLGRMKNSTQELRDEAGQIIELARPLAFSKGNRRRSYGSASDTGRVKQVVTAYDQATHTLTQATNEVLDMIQARQDEVAQVAANRVMTREQQIDEIQLNLADTKRIENRSKRLQDYDRRLLAPGRMIRHWYDVDNLTRAAENRWDGGGVLWNLLHRRMKDAEESYNVDMRDESLFLDVLVREAGFRNLADALAKTMGTLGESSVETMDVTLGDKLVRITLDQGLEFLALDAQTLAKIEAGAPIQFAEGLTLTPIQVTLEEIEGIRQILEEQYGILAEAMKARLETSIRPRSFAVKTELTGRTPVVVPGYWPTSRNVAKSPDVGLAEAFRSNEARTRMLENAGFFEERTRDDKSPIVIKGLMRRYTEHIDHSLKIIHLAIPMRNALAVIMNPRFQTLMMETHGASMNTYLQAHLLEASLVNREASSGPDRVASMLNSRMVGTYLTTNVGTYLRQIGGLYKLMGHMPLKYFRIGLQRMRPGTYNEMLAHSGFISNRYSGDSPGRFSPVKGQGVEALDNAGFRMSIGALIRSTTQKDIKGMGMSWDRVLRTIKLLDWFDAINARVAWVGYQQMVEDQHPDWTPEQKMRWVALNTAEAMRSTQNTSSPLDAAGMAMRSRSNWLRYPLLFSSDTLKSANQLIRSAHQEDPRVAAKMAIGVLLNFIHSAFVTTGTVWFGIELLGMGIRAALGKGPEGDDQKEARKYALLERMLWRFMRDVAGMVPVVGDGIVSGVQSTLQGWGSDGVLDIPIIDAVNDAVEPAIDMIPEAVEAIVEGDWLAFVLAIADGLWGFGWNSSVLLGNPVMQPYYKIKHLWQVIDDEPEQRKNTPLADFVLGREQVGSGAGSGPPPGF